jgi:hypothetical protein
MLDDAHFASCYLLLLARLWEEFDRLAADIESAHGGSQGGTARTVLRVQTLRLELLLLRDRCDQVPLRAKLGTERTLLLQAVLGDLEACLDSVSATPEPLAQRAAVWQAQDRLFDETQLVASSLPNVGERTAPPRTAAADRRSRESAPNVSAIAHRPTPQRDRSRQPGAPR